MTNKNQQVDLFLTPVQYEHLPSPLHKMTVDILISRGECIVKENKSANRKLTDGQEKSS